MIRTLTRPARLMLRMQRTQRTVGKMLRHADRQLLPRHRLRLNRIHLDAIPIAVPTRRPTPRRIRIRSIRRPLPERRKRRRRIVIEEEPPRFPDAGARSVGGQRRRVDPAGFGWQERDAVFARQVDGHVLVGVRGRVHGFRLRGVDGRLAHSHLADGARGREPDFSVPAHDAVPARGGDGEVADARGGAERGGRSVGLEAQGAGDAVEEGVCWGSFAGLRIVGVEGVVFEAQGALGPAVETFSGCEGGGLLGISTLG